MTEEPTIQFLSLHIDDLMALVNTRFDNAAKLDDTHRRAHDAEHANHQATHQREREADVDRLAEVSIASNKANEWRGAMDDRERTLAKKAEVDAEFKAVREAQWVLKAEMDRRFDEQRLSTAAIERTLANWTGRMAVVTVLLLMILSPIAALAVKSLAGGNP